MRKDRDQLRTLIEASKFDETTVRALAEKQADARTEMIVSKARMWHRINAVLTPEQREKAKELRPPMGKKGGRHHHGPRDW
jgi:protein CpxP